ncbi:filamentous hemagglutinin N-terminal domain-containing protein [Anabaena sp. UHCC 0187]|uniref:two-partner secretion domain-containing protein n=1 Tax=Anabaena sp. UHCC 0187 TaxID=2590018 RepID=UPI0020C3BB6C|nr:filamentous hemagglutinin N-terminal domain-containing protein [Anabaena sp. UHCC 0187]
MKIFFSRRGAESQREIKSLVLICKKSSFAPLLLCIFARNFILFPFPALAQIIPDNSLGSEKSQIINDNIAGGAIRGSSLFHSFQEFNVSEAKAVYFTNPNNITNIFTRVTGSNPSNILGTLGVLGNANLFLLNPQGIVFGKNAQLDLRGSFFASTADSVVFNNGFEFSSSNPQVPLLTVNMTVGLRFRDHQGTIINQSQAVGTLNLPPLPETIPIDNHLGLAVDDGQALALLGGNIQLDNGNLTANNGQIILGSVANSGLVNFTVSPQNVTVNYDNIQNFGNIEITNNSLINTSGMGGGQINLQGENLLLNSSQIFALTLGNLAGKGININAQQFRSQAGSKISTTTYGEGAGGAINIRTTDSVELSGVGFPSLQNLIATYLITGIINSFDLPIVLSNNTFNTGTAGDITIDTGNLLLENGAAIGGGTYSSQNGGKLNIHAKVVELVSSGINSGNLRGSTGTGGDIYINSQQLIVRDGSSLASLNRGEGASGNINIQASESVEILRTPAGSVSQTLIGTTSFGATGKAGDITIDTKRLLISEGAGITLTSGVAIGNVLLNPTGGLGGNLTIKATESVELSGVSGVLANGGKSVSFLSADTYTSSRGGDIYLSTPLLTLENGGIISAASLGTGDAGNITIDAGRVQLLGIQNPGELNSRIQASVGIVGDFTNAKATANAGSLNLNVQQLLVQNESTINVQGLGTGKAGSINIVADTIALNNKGSINGSTDAGGGGNINITAKDIQLRRASTITTDAGSSDGGNININSDTLLAFPQENSDITANARTAQGGKVTVNVPYIFGFTAVSREQVRERLGLTDAQFAALQVSPTSLLNTSDIAAFSQVSGASLQGAVTFSTSGVNPAQGLVEIPENVVDPNTLIAANPCTRGAGSEFSITGRGGVPPSPSDALSGNSQQFAWVEEAGVQGAGSRGQGEIITNYQLPVPVRGWVINEQGEVTLLAYEPTGQFSQRSWRPLSNCQPQ